MFLAYASRALTPAEQNYPAHKLEFLALKWAVCEKFHDYLYDSKFEIKTDNNPLTYIQTSARLDATGHRWLAALSAYDFSLLYRAGKKNIDADVLSRLPGDMTIQEVKLEHDTVQQFCHLAKLQEPVIVSCMINSAESANGLDPDAHIGQTHLPAKDVVRLQQEDFFISAVICHLQKGVKPSAFSIRKMRRPVQLLFREWSKPRIIDNIFYRERERDRWW